MTPTVAVIAVGNPLRGDDGVGAEALDLLRRIGPPVTYLELDGEPTRLLDAWRGFDTVVVLDACRTGAAPGTIHSLDPLRVGSTVPARTVSGHGGGLPDAIELGRALDRLPRHLHLFAVEIESVATGHGLSAPVGAAVPVLVDAVLGLLSSLGHDGTVSAVSTPSSQKNSRFPTPPRWLIPHITKANVWIYRRSNGRVGARGGGMDQLLLTVKGRKSGKVQTVCLPYWLDAEGRRVVVASFAGGPHHPAWYHNVADTSANPTVSVQDKAHRFTARASVLAGEERDTVWAALTADRPFYNDYQAKTERRIPLVRLEPLA